MRRFIVAAVLLTTLLAAQFLSAGQTQASSPAASRPGSVSGATPAPITETQADRDILDGRLMMARKDYTGAAEIFERLAKQYPHDPSYPNFAGIALMQETDLEGARKMFERATRVDRKFADGFNNLGTVWFSLKDYRKAIREYQKALALRPTTAAYYTNLGYAYFNLGKLPEALDNFHHALAMDPGVFDATARDGPILQDRSVSDHGLFNYTMAKSYAQLGDGAHCAIYLRRASEEGYKQLMKARTDPAFAPVLTSPDVQMVLDELAPLPTPAPVPPAEAPKG
jgi:tetratricopeptide (TPR) repeat protein